MKDFEREEANIDELEQIGEFQHFKEEDYQCNEIINDGLEEFKVKEIQPQSFVENENVTIKKEKKDNDKLRKKINNQLKTSINTSATTTSAVTVVTITVAVSTGIVTSPFDNYGKLDFNNYRVDNKIVYDEELGQNIKYKDIEIYFDENLNEGYDCYVLNKQTQEKLKLDNIKDYVKFSDLDLDEYNFEVQVIDDSSKIIKTFEVDVNTICEYEYLEEIPYEYTVTYNEDNTSNLYFNLNMLYEDENFVNYLELVNDEGESLNYSSKENENILFIENIVEEEFMIVTSSYYKKEGNYYLINRNYLNDFMPHKLSYTMNIDLNELLLAIYNEANSNLEVSVKYLDDNSIEKYNVSKNSINESQEIIINLPRLTSEIEVTLSGEFIMYGEVESIKINKGTYIKKIVETQILKPDIYNKLEIDRVEIFKDNYSEIMNASLYFKGYLMDGNYFEVNVYDSSGLLITSQTNIDTLKYPITFNDLDQSQLLTFEYIMKDIEGNEVIKNQYQTSVSIPSEYLSIDYTFYYMNPNEVYITYNDDKTYNIYFPVEFENRSEFDVNYKISISDGYDNTYELIGKEKTPVLLNCDPSTYYTLQYGVYVKDGIKLYSIGYITSTSGSVSIDYNEDGSIKGQAYMTHELQEDNTYLFSMNAKVYSDLDVKIILDDLETVELTIPLSEITFENISSTFTIDLTNYQFTYADITFSGMINEYTQFESRVDKSLIEGSGYALHTYNVLIY